MLSSPFDDPYEEQTYREHSPRRAQVRDLCNLRGASVSATGTGHRDDERSDDRPVSAVLMPSHRLPARAQTRESHANAISYAPWSPA